MSFPHPDKFNLLVAASTPGGDVEFLEVPGPSSMSIPGVSHAPSYWKVVDGHSLSNSGNVPVQAELADHNGSALSAISFPAHSAGEPNADELDGGFDAPADEHGDDTSMHATETID